MRAHSLSALLLLTILAPLPSLQQGACPREDELTTETEDECYQRSVLCQYYPFGNDCGDNITTYRGFTLSGNTGHELQMETSAFRTVAGSNYQVAVSYGCDLGAVTVEAFDEGVLCDLGFSGVQIDAGRNEIRFTCPGFETLTIRNSSVIIFTLDETNNSSVCQDLPDAKFAILDSSSCLDAYCNVSAAEGCTSPSGVSVIADCHDLCRFFYSNSSVYSPCLMRNCQTYDYVYCALAPTLSVVDLYPCFTMDTSTNCLPCLQDNCGEYIDQVCQLDCTTTFLTHRICGDLCSGYFLDVADSCCHNPCLPPPPPGSDCTANLSCEGRTELCAPFCLNSTTREGHEEICSSTISEVCSLDCDLPHNAGMCRILCEQFNASLSELCQASPCSPTVGTNLTEDCAGTVYAGLSCTDNLAECVEQCFDFRDLSAADCQVPFCQEFTSNCSSPLYSLQCNASKADQDLCNNICNDTDFVILAEEVCLESEHIVNYCLGIEEDTECAELDIFQTNCATDKMLCRNICTITISLALMSQCPQSLHGFCEDFFAFLLEGNITEEAFETGVAVLDRLIAEDDVINGSLIAMGEFVDALTENVVTAAEILEEDEAIRDFVNLFDQVFNDSQLPEWELLEIDDDIREASLEIFERANELIGSAFINETRDPFNFTGDSIAMEVGAVAGAHKESREYTFPDPVKAMDNEGGVAQSLRMSVPTSLLCGNTSNCSAVVAASITKNLAGYIHETVQDGQEEVNSNLFSLQVLESPGLLARLQNNPISFSFKMLNSTLGGSTHRCVAWNFTEQSWSDDGITTSVEDSSTVLCSASHLTSFAVLVNVQREPMNETVADVALNIVSYIGCAISIVCLIITIFTLVAFRKVLNKGVLLYIHINLSVALLLALLVFVAGVETATSIPVLCMIIAALLHYLLLAVFCWMLCEAIMLYLLVVKVFGVDAQKRWYYLLLLGWGLPVIIVGVSVGALVPMDLYVTSSEYCWISSGNASDPALWTFVGPMLVIILINTVILVMTVVSMVKGRKHGGAEMEVKNTELAKTAIKATVVLLPLLGITWVLGLFAVDANTIVFAWLFTIFNSLQGFFILVFHVLRNDAFTRRVKRMFGSMREKTSYYFTSSSHQEANGMSKTMEMSLSTMQSRATLTSVTSESLLISNCNGNDLTNNENCKNE